MAKYLVTGANRGLGYEFSRQLLEAGHDVWGICRDPENAEDLKKLVETSSKSDSSGTLTLRRGDVSDEESLKEASQGLENLDVLINNAGIMGQRETKLNEICLEQMSRVLDINVYGIVRSTRVFLPFLKKGREKRIVNISSLMGSISDNGTGHYSGYRVSKGAVNMLTRNFGHELEPNGFTVLALHPGWVQTDMGGPAAPLNAVDSVRSMIRVLQSKSTSESGGFFDRFGKALPF